MKFRIETVAVKIDYRNMYDIYIFQVLVKILEKLHQVHVFRCWWISLMLTETEKNIKKKS